MQIFVDMDGVLADFDRHYEAYFGQPPPDDVDWGLIRKIPNFYANLPPMPDMAELWRFLEPYKPIVLTGVPNNNNVPGAADEKRAWGRRHLGAHVEVRCCRSKDKCLHAAPGDVLIDDWDRYRHLWLAKGGRWITHWSAAETIAELRTILKGREYVVVD